MLSPRRRGTFSALHWPVEAPWLEPYPGQNQASSSAIPHSGTCCSGSCDPSKPHGAKQTSARSQPPDRPSQPDARCRASRGQVNDSHLQIALRDFVHSQLGGVFALGIRGYFQQSAHPLRFHELKIRVALTNVRNYVSLLLVPLAEVDIVGAS